MLRQQTSWEVVPQPPRHILTPGTSVRDVRRIGVAACDTERLPDALIASDSRLPIIDAARHAGKRLPGIGEIRYAEIEIDSCDPRANPAGHGQLGDRLGGQLDSCQCGAGV